MPDDFDGDRGFESSVDTQSAIDRSHATAADLGSDPVRPDNPANQTIGRIGRTVTRFSASVGAARMDGPSGLAFPGISGGSSF
jgi:hypothetical protein